MIGMVGYNGFLRDKELEESTLSWLEVVDPQSVKHFETQSDYRHEMKDAFQSLVVSTFNYMSKVLSCGHVLRICPKYHTGASTCSSTVGGSGSSYSLIEAPERGVVGMHLGAGLKLKKHAYEFKNHTLFVTVNHPQFVAKWAKDALPYLTDNDREKVQGYIEKHYDIIKHIG